MTDLEIIKENAHRLYVLESYEPYEVDRDAIIEAAERMAGGKTATAILAK